VAGIVSLVAGQRAKGEVEGAFWRTIIQDTRSTFSPWPVMVAGGDKRKNIHGPQLSESRWGP
jgi:hypothetical protein